jgi:Secretion system C-terminal sorting domain
LKKPQYANEWQGNYTNYGAFHADINGNIYQKSTFYYNNTLKSTYLASPFHPLQADWFKFTQKTDIAYIFEPCVPTTIIPVINPNTDAFIKSTIDGSLYPPTPRGRTQQWLAERQLYDLLKVSNYSEGQFTDLDEFLTNNSNSSAKQFFDLDEQIKTIKAIPNALQVEIEEHNNQLLQQYQLLSVHDSMFHYNTINQRPISPSFWDIRAIINGKITTQKSILQEIDAHLTEERITQATILKEINNQVIGDEIYEANERDVNTVILDMLINQQDSFDVNQEDILTHIALQCPEEGGWAVFEARSILAQKYNYEYNFDEICGKTIINKTQKAYNYNTLTIAPNPVKDEFTVFIAQNDNTHYDKLQITDMYGRIVYSATMGEKEKSIRINSATFANGSYQCILFENGVALARQKLIKISL